MSRSSLPLSLRSQRSQAAHLTWQARSNNSFKSKLRGSTQFRRYLPMSHPIATELPLRGSRISIRALELEDVEALYEVECDTEVKRYLGGVLAKPRDSWIASMSKSCPSATTLAVCLASTGELLGRAAFSPTLPFRDEVALEIVLGRAAWGKGYGREAAGVLLSRATTIRAAAIEATVHPDNTASLSLLASFGFQFVKVCDAADWQHGHHMYRLAVGT
ncbi:Protein N-acetyltransferase, RimJ/RimL family [Pseudoxanthomonas wuyuanensis]|uniref:Protein N-acetyltransferase, RimJ/RimL family n=3 Tax=Pseudoxanthomonas wuyuanensis TaxID=1073196 RepID=A0A286D2H3_9GAMM|nr:Protein N-acetyltransferase, RimJ/RimL family [Pseudoxanthomonas wuyuanensis]